MMKQADISSYIFQRCSPLLLRSIAKLYFSITIRSKLDTPYFFRLLAAAIVVLTIGVVPASTAYAQDKPSTSAQPADAPTDIVITKTYLLESPKGATTPHLIVKHYDASKGLLAGYQSENGKRILFRARNRLGLGVVAQVLHYDPNTGKVHNLMGRSRTTDDKGNTIKDIQVGGIDLMTLLKSAKRKSSDFAAREGQAKKFLATEEGSALIEAIPALYAALDDLNDDPDVQQLKQSFGAIAMGLQLGTNQFAGIKNAEKIHGAAKLKKMQDACHGEKNCSLRGKSFTVYQSGLFDAISKTFIKSTKTISGEFPSITVAPSRSLISQLTSETSVLSNVPINTQLKNGDGNCTDPGPCFGYCGLGCLAPGAIATPQCLGHDLCVCQYGHAACISSVLLGCGGSNVPCYDLVDAALSWLGGIWDALAELWDWIVSWFDDDPDDPCNGAGEDETPVPCQGG
jgi:hypothetical protein